MNEMLPEHKILICKKKIEIILLENNVSLHDSYYGDDVFIRMSSDDLIEKMDLRKNFVIKDLEEDLEESEEDYDEVLTLKRKKIKKVKNKIQEILDDYDCSLNTGYDYASIYLKDEYDNREEF